MYSKSIRSFLLPSKDQHRPLLTDREACAKLMMSVDKEESSLAIILAIAQKIMPVNSTDSPQSSNLNGMFSFSMFLLAVYSSMVFFPSALQAGKRYAAMAPESLELPISLGGAGASLVTNTFFNWPAFCEIWGSHASFSLLCQDAATAFFKQPGRHTFAFLASAGTILPFWSISLTNDILWNLFVTTAAILNMPVFYSGSEKFFEVMAYAEVKRFQLRCLWLWNAFCCRDLPEINDAIEYTKVKSLLATHFLDLVDNFRMADDLQKKNFKQLFLDVKTKEGALKILLNYKDHNILPDYCNPIRKNCNLWFLKYFVLGGVGMLQNYGHGVETYRFGVQYHWSLGAVCVLLNMLPGLGYTIKGIMGFGLVELFLELLSSRKSQNTSWSHCCSMMTLIILVVRLCYCFSGLSGDELNYQSVLYFNSKDFTSAIVIGLLSNIGTALVFNAPQCEIKIKEMHQPDLMQKQLDEMVDEVRNLPLNTISEVIYNSKTEEMMQTFFKSKKFQLTVVESNTSCIV